MSSTTTTTTTTGGSSSTTTNTNTNTTTAASTSTTTTTTTTTAQPPVVTRPVHPCVYNQNDFVGSRGCEFTTWAYLVPPSSSSTTNNNDDDRSSSIGQVPNLVTATGSTIHVYSVVVQQQQQQQSDNNITTTMKTSTLDPMKQQQQVQQQQQTTKLLFEYTFSNLAGTIIHLSTLRSNNNNNNNATASSSSRRTDKDHDNNDNDNDDADHYDDDDDDSFTCDALLVAFAGQPRLSVVHLTTSSSSLHNNNTSNSTSNTTSNSNNNHNYYPILQADCLIDFTMALSDCCYGSSMIFEQDMNVSCLNHIIPGIATVACILGGGVVVAIFTLVQTNTQTQSTSEKNHRVGTNTNTSSGWKATEPYLLPLKHLSDALPHHLRDPTTTSGLLATSTTTTSAGAGALTTDTSSHVHSNINITNSNTSIVTGFGDILCGCFLRGYLEPTLAILHTEPGGLPWTGRLGRTSNNNKTKDTTEKEKDAKNSTSSSGVHHPIYVSALSIAVTHHRTALLWCREVPTDSFTIISASESQQQQQQSNQYANHNHQNHPWGCMIVANNSITILAPSGLIQQVLAVNGLAYATCPTSLLSYLQPNPLVKCSIQLHGCQTTTLQQKQQQPQQQQHRSSSSSSSGSTDDNDLIVVVLRYGQVYVLQRTATTATGTVPSSTTITTTTTTTTTMTGEHQQEHEQQQQQQQQRWVLFNTGQSIGNIGEIATVTSIGYNSNKNKNDDPISESKDQQQQQQTTATAATPPPTTTIPQQSSYGYLFTGSRLGDSLLLGYTLEKIMVPSWNEYEIIPNKTNNNILHLDKNLELSSSSSTKDEVMMNYFQSLHNNENNQDNEMEDEYDRILRIEEEALYAESSSSSDPNRLYSSVPDIIPPSDEEEGNNDNDNDNNNNNIDKKLTKKIEVPSMSATTRKNRRRESCSTRNEVRVTVLRSLRPLDCLVNTGPLGPPCEGPIASTPSYLMMKYNNNNSNNNKNSSNTDEDNDDEDDSTKNMKMMKKDEMDQMIGTGLVGNQKNRMGSSSSSSLEPIYGTSAHIYPCGFGSSGGLALVTVPGRDDRVIVNEMDCLHIDATYHLPSLQVVILVVGSKLGGGIRALRFVDITATNTTTRKKNPTDKSLLQEIDLEQWCSSSSRSSCTKMKMEDEEEMDSFNTPTNPILHILQHETIVGVCDCDYLNHFLVVYCTKSETGYGYRYYVVLMKEEEEEKEEEMNQHLCIVHTIELITKTKLEETKQQHNNLLRISPFVRQENNNNNNNNTNNGISTTISFSCLWETGEVTVIHVDPTRTVDIFKFFTLESSIIINTTSRIEFNRTIEDPDELELKQFYSNRIITAIDLFRAPKGYFINQLVSSSSFTSHSSDDPMIMESIVKDTNENDMNLDESSSSSSSNNKFVDPLSNGREQQHAMEISDIAGDIFTELDEEDEELYGIESRKKKKNTNQQYTTSSGKMKNSTRLDDRTEQGLFLMVSRMTGDIEIYSMDHDGRAFTDHNPVWVANGAGIGSLYLQSCTTTTTSQSKKNHHHHEIRLPRSHMTCVQEIRCFPCQLSNQTESSSPSVSSSSRRPSDFCLALETSDMDIHLYQLKTTSMMGEGSSSFSPYFQRIPLRTITRPSHDQIRHRTTLQRKGVLGKVDDNNNNDNNDEMKFMYNSLLSFRGISGQDGLFVAGSRPMWIVSERGKPTVIAHRTRHAAPAGGMPRPVRCFCPNIFPSSSSSGGGGGGGFITIHERVGRIGCQRLTVFKDLSPIFDSHGILPGSGYCVEKIPMGVSVRQIKFIDDYSVSTGTHPLYAILVSRELELDQSSLNNDGLTPAERKQMEDEKESAKIKKQVEADLGGFDMESEWVEEIEREECFRIDTDLGGAPPLRQSAYSLWIVDAANKWIVVDSFELEEYEYGLDLQVLYLTDFRDENDSGVSNMDNNNNNNTKRTFLAVGTGMVNHNGEDVSSKGRTILFEIKPCDPDSRLTISSIAELSLCYEKEMFHGPVTTLSCLSSEGKNRLVIGAGSDVNIEQWGNGKLTQVGFYRATMQIMKITIFKTFLLLSDAYDSLYFLVWRESDKSITLLAKDYDPIPVYAAGIMSRGAAMTFLCHDDRQNIQFFQYAPGESAARGGNKLVCRADIHFGSQTTSFTSHYCRSSLQIHSATPTSTVAALKQQDTLFGRNEDDNRLAVHFGTTDGCFVSIVPLSEPVYWRMLALQSVMSNAIESDCGLSRRTWRLYRRTARRGGCRSNERKRGVIDGDLVVQYIDLPTALQEDIASAIGTTVSLILDNLLELHCASMIL